MAVSGTVRKGVLALHIMASVGWMGAATSFAVLDTTTAVASDTATLRAAYVAMELLALFALVPLALATVASGIAIAVLTPWGLFRHWWVVVTLVLTVLATVVLLLQVPTIMHRADVASAPETPDAALGQMGNLLLHSVGGAAVLGVIAALNVFKPRGLTRHGWRQQQAMEGPRSSQPPP